MKRSVIKTLEQLWSTKGINNKVDLSVNGIILEYIRLFEKLGDSKRFEVKQGLMLVQKVSGTSRTN